MTNTDEPLFIATGSDAPREDLPFVEREAITAVVYNPNTNQYLGLRWNDIDWETFITGGIEAGQTAEAAARAEVKEETGYVNLQLIKELPRYHSKFYHTPKGVNRFAHFHSFLFALTDETQVPVSDEETTKHKSIWLNEADLTTFKLPEGHRFLLNHILHD